MLCKACADRRDAVFYTFVLQRNFVFVLFVFFRSFRGTFDGSRLVVDFVEYCGRLFGNLSICDGRSGSDRNVKRCSKSDNE